MSETVATVTITLATLIAMTIIGVYAIKTMTKIANKDNDKQQILLYIVIFYLDFLEVKMNVDNELKCTYEFDDVARMENNGVYVVPSNGERKIKIRDLLRYCKDNNKESSQLSKSEIERFYK